MDSKKKRTTSLSLSSRTVKPNLQSKRSSYVQISNCNFCQQKVSKHDLKYFFSMTNKALYSKYSSSQNYYYTKDINDILANAKVPSVIIFRDLEVYEECEEYLKRFYRGIEYDGKIKMLTEYYKYHQDIPRLFIYPIINTLNRYHDKKRRLDYLRITKMLRDQNNQNEGDNKKVLKGRDVRRSIKSDYIPITDRVLAELELTQSNVMKTKEDLIKVEGNWRADSLQKSAEKTAHSGSLKAYRDKLGMAINKKLMKEADKTMEQMREASVSNTLHDLNMKLGEIINKSYSVNFENSEYQAKDNTISNLGNFLNYMHDNQQSAKLNRIPEITHTGISGSGVFGSGVSASVKIPQPQVMQHEYYRSDAPEPESRVYASKNKLDFESLIDERTRDISTGTGLNLAEKLLKEKQPYELGAGIIKSTTKKLEPPPPQRKSIKQETERPFTALAASKMNGVGTNMTAALKGKSVPMTILKIQNFEEVMKARQQGSPIKVNSQRSTSTEKYQKRPPSAISHRAYNAATKESSVKKPSKSRQEEMMSQRRGSQVRQADLTETSNSSRMILKSRSSINNIKDPRTTEFSTLVTQQYNDPPNSHREMRVYVDNMNSNPMSRQSTTSGRIVSTARTSQAKVAVPTTMHNNMVGAGHVSHERTKSMRTTQALGVKDLRNMVGLCQINLHDASRDSKVNRSSASKTGMIRPVPSKSRLEYSGGGGSSNMSPVIPEQDMLNFKRQFEKLNKNSLQSSRDNITRHKSTKSDVRMFESGTLDLSKKVSPMQAPVSSRDRNQSPFELAKYERDQNLTARPQIYNYNTNNIVNIFVNPASQENKNKSIIKMEPKRTGSLTDRDRYASNSSSGTGGVKIVSSKPMGSDVFMKYNNQQAKRQEFIDNLIKRDSTRESPVMILKKDEGSGLGLQPQIKLTRSKRSFVNNQNNVVKSALHSKIQKKIELDLMEEMRSTPDSYEFLVNFRSKR